MKLVVFSDKKSILSSDQAVSISRIVKGNLLDNISKEERSRIDDEYQSLIGTIVVDQSIKTGIENPIIFNLYGVKSCPSVVFINNGEVIYRWEGKVPEVLEIVTSIKNYLKILKLNVMDYDYDPDE